MFSLSSIRYLKFYLFALRARCSVQRLFTNGGEISLAIIQSAFIATGVFDEPHKPFIVPKWKDPKDAAPIFSIGGNKTRQESNRWFANIPLKIKDDEVVSIIQQRLERDMAHIKQVCLVKFEEFLERERRNNAFLKTGLVKPS